jgi:hypothetical protein
MKRWSSGGGVLLLLGVGWLAFLSCTTAQTCITGTRSARLHHRQGAFFQSTAAPFNLQVFLFKLHSVLLSGVRDSRSEAGASIPRRETQVHNV